MIRMRTRTFVVIDSNDNGNNANMNDGYGGKRNSNNWKGNSRNGNGCNNGNGSNGGNGNGCNNGNGSYGRNGSGWNGRNGNCWNNGKGKKESRIRETSSSHSSVGLVGFLVVETGPKVSVSGRSKARAIERRDVSTMANGLTTDGEDASLWEDQMIRMRNSGKKFHDAKNGFFEQMRERGRRVNKPS